MLSSHVFQSVPSPRQTPMLIVWPLWNLAWPACQSVSMQHKMKCLISILRTWPVWIVDVRFVPVGEVRDYGCDAGYEGEEETGAVVLELRHGERFSDFLVAF